MNDIYNMEVPPRFDTIYDPSGERRQSAKCIIDCMMNSAKFKNSSIAYKTGIVVGIERGILNYTVESMENKNKIASWTLHFFVNEYKCKRYLICGMLEKIGDPINEFLEMIIMTRAIDWNRLAFARVSELNPEKYAAIIRDLDIRSKACIEYTFIDGVISCKNCGSKKYREYSVQWRSSDEPAHHFLVCGGCGKRTRGN